MGSHKRLYIALVIGLVIHGISLPFTFEGTYDAFVHIFFADHYAHDWFESWNDKWYTGFTITSYPPLVHQFIALTSKVIGLKAGFLLWGFLMVLVFVRGVYQFSRIWVDEKSAGYAAILAVFSTSFVQAFHIFGQLPSITGVAILLNACYELYRWLRYDEKFRFLTAISLLAITSTAHHVTTIFGMVFFILPVIGGAIYKVCLDEQQVVTIKLFFQKILRNAPRLFGFGILVIGLTILVLFPYWYWSKTDPITQISIPHGSRDDYLDILSSGMMFFLIPWGVMLLFLPSLFRQIFQKKNLFIGLSILLAFILGTGGTTPIPRMILGNTSFEILTLDRFTFWATILSLPFWGLFVQTIIEAGFSKEKVRKGRLWYQVAAVLLGLGIIVSTVVTINFQKLIKVQPEKIEMVPITQFLERDLHSEWRYLTLGFGDQMAWLAANTDALSVDGNYHSARRLPELTEHAVERLENSKYLGSDGLKSLQEFISMPEKYSLKYIFSNDKFYDPALFFYGWNRLQQLENDIVVWERPDVPNLPGQLARKNIPVYQRFMWGVIPFSVLIIGLIIFISVYFYYRNSRFSSPIDKTELSNTTQLNIRKIDLFWMFGLLAFSMATAGFLTIKNADHHNPENLIRAYYRALDFKEFEKAYSLYETEGLISYEKYITYLSRDGGLLASYAKLDSLDLEIESPENESTVNVSARSVWLTALGEYEQTEYFQCTRKDGKWNIIPEMKIPLPAMDQFIRMPEMTFYNQGRRHHNPEGTAKQDILDRPDVYIPEASLIEQEGNYFVVGELINLDNDPAYVNVEVIFLDENNVEIQRRQARDVIKHVLYPKESTDFRVDFEKMNASANPLDSSTSLPARFVLFARSVVAEDEVYQHTAVQLISFNEEKIEGDFINSGAGQVIIPQLLIAQLHSNGQLVNVISAYLPKGIRPQRQQYFEFEMLDIENFSIIETGSDQNLIVNGVQRNLYLDALDTSSKEILGTFDSINQSYIMTDSGTGLRIRSNALPAAIYDVNK